MKIISLGLQCSVPEGIRTANVREYSYPFDWLWTPSKTTYDILNILINDGIEKAVEYMTTGYTYYRYLGNEHYISVDTITESQMNKTTGLGNTHFIINDEYKNKLHIRLGRFLRDIKSDEKILLIYADASNPSLNYHLDDIEYGLDATDYLLKIYELLYPLNHNIKIIYFCWNERKKENGMIEYISYDYKNSVLEVSEIIKNYLLTLSLNNNS
jgi:hypothetical protein